MEDKDTQLLARAAANHLYLAQFEPFRATLLSLRARNPDLARAILETLVSLNGRLDNILWSRSCPNPSLLTYLSTLELLQFNDAVSPTWSFDPDSLRLRVEFSLYVEIIRSKSKELGGELVVLDKLAELGLSRLKPDLIDERKNGEGSGGGGLVLEEEELMCVRKVVLENSMVFDVLCENIQKQVEGGVRDDSGLAITLRREGEQSEDEDARLMKLVQRSVQIVHLDAMRECLEEGDEEGVVSHIRFLHLGYGVEETGYWYGLFTFLID